MGIFSICSFDVLPLSFPSLPFSLLTPFHFQDQHFVEKISYSLTKEQKYLEEYYKHIKEGIISLR